MEDKMGEKKLFSVMMMAAVLFAPGCGDGNGGDEDADAQPDTDAAEDTLPDPDAAEEPADVPQEDGIEDPAEEEAPETCSGSDTLTLEFVDGDENPVEGVAVALRCLSEVSEATSGSDGRVSFDNLDLAATPVDFTYVYWEKAFSVVGMGGDTPIPNPLQISLDLVTEDLTVNMQGDAVHSTPGSMIMLVSYTSWFNVITGDRYTIRSGLGTDLGLTAYEFVYEGDDVNLLAYSYQTYDLPSAGMEGPVVAPSASADIRTRTVQLDFDLAPGSPLQDKVISRIEPIALATSGAVPAGYDSFDNMMSAGLTTSWVEGETSDTLEISWAQDGVDVIVTNLSLLLINDLDFTAAFRMMLPQDPADWEDSYTVHDVPEIPGQEPEVPLTFDQTIDVAHPDWAAPYSVMSYNIRLSGIQPSFGIAPYRWCVTVHPDVDSFSFADLPLPSTITYDDLFMGSSMWTGVAVVSYDEDPVQDAELVANSRCGLAYSNFGPNFFKAAASDLRYEIETP